MRGRVPVSVGVLAFVVGAGVLWPPPSVGQKGKAKMARHMAPSEAPGGDVFQVSGSGNVILKNSPHATVFIKAIYEPVAAQTKPSANRGNSRKSYAAFWLGSRLPALFDLYRQGWKMAQEQRTLLLSTIDKMLDDRKLLLGISADFVKHFRDMVSSSEDKGAQGKGREFLMQVADELQKQGDEQAFEWWSIGIGVGATWNTARIGLSPQQGPSAGLECIRSMRLLRQSLQIGHHGREIADELGNVETKLQSSAISAAQVVASIPTWLVDLESEILAGKKLAAPEEINKKILDDAPVLAINLLKSYLKRHPDDYQAVFFKGKAAASAILVHGPAFDPMLYVDEVQELRDSLERQIAIRPNAPKTEEARKLLAIVAPIAKASSKPREAAQK